MKKIILIIIVTSLIFWIAIAGTMLYNIANIKIMKENIQKNL